VTILGIDKPWWSALADRALAALQEIDPAATVAQLAEAGGTLTVHFNSTAPRRAKRYVRDWARRESCCTCVRCGTTDSACLRQWTGQTAFRRTLCDSCDDHAQTY